ncbi:DUF4199 family protein [Melioribacter sp. Ez-97]|uniref:DUF4199 family protein n=1 Tax=Melioribacter sp. Ez-97 TaxID=3423434 RepID=UPI003ED9CFDF
MKKHLPALVSGFGAGVLSIVPLAKGLTCCIIVPVAAYIALILDRKSTRDSGRIPASRGFTIGVMTGVFAALFGSLFDIIITFITHSNDIVDSFPEFQKMINDFPVSEAVREEIIRMFQNLRSDIVTTGFSFLYTFSVLINNFVVNTLFGAVGGLAGAQIINNRVGDSEE